MDPTRLFELKMTILKMASDMLTNEYVDKKAENHNQWLIQNEMMWRTQRVKVPYPAFPPYPTQAEVLKKADELWNCFVLDSSVQKEMKGLDNVDSIDAELPNVLETDNSSPITTRIGPENSVEETSRIRAPTAELEVVSPILLPDITHAVEPRKEQEFAISVIKNEIDAVQTKAAEDTPVPEVLPVDQNTSRLGNFGNWLLRKTN